MTSTRQTGVRLMIALVALAVLAVLAVGAVGAAAAPASLRALDLSSPSLGTRVTVTAAGGGTFSAEPGRALLRVTPAGGPAAQVLAWCVDPARSISEGIDYSVDLQIASDTPALAAPGFSQAGWLIAQSDRMIADAADPGLEAAAIQVAVWQLTGGVPDAGDVTSSAALNTRAAQIRAAAAGRTIVTELAVSAPSAPVAVGTPVTVTVTGTPGAVVDLSVTSGAALSAVQVVIGPSGAGTVTVTPSAAGAVTIGASAQGGMLNRAVRVAGRSTPQAMAYVSAVPLAASATITVQAPAVVAPLPVVVVPAAAAQVPVAALGLTKTAPATTRAGRVIAYHLTVTNVSTTVARTVVVRDPVPRRTYVTRLPGRARLRSGAVEWRLGDLAPGARVTLVLRLRTDRLARGKVVNRATAVAANAAVVRAQARTRMVIAPRRVAPAVVAPAVTG